MSKGERIGATGEENPSSMILDKPLRALLALPGVHPLLTFVFGRRAVIRGWSMYPTLAPGEYVLFDRFAYRRNAPGRGDVVLASHPSRPGMRIVKRIVALPGDVVAIDGERCWVNGAPYGETAGEPPASGRTWDLGDGEYLLLGDAPYASTDAREFGAVGRDLLHARAWLVYWPPSRVRVVGRCRRTEGQA
jgi:signal peptidase I